jgi:hypothetical protein
MGRNGRKIRGHTISIVWHICLAMSKQAHGRAWIYLHVEPGFQRRRCVDNWWTSRNALAPRIHNYNKRNLSNARIHVVVCAKRVVQQSSSFFVEVEVSREKP